MSQKQQFSQGLSEPVETALTRNYIRRILMWRQRIFCKVPNSTTPNDLTMSRVYQWVAIRPAEIILNGLIIQTSPLVFFVVACL